MHAGGKRFRPLFTLVAAGVGPHPESENVIIASAVKAVIGLRPDTEAEEEGLDQVDHGEAGYHLEEEGHIAARLSETGGVGASGLTRRAVAGANDGEHS